MDGDSEYPCSRCGQQFSSRGALSYHTRACKLGNKRLLSSFDSAQSMFRAKKRRIQQVLQGLDPTPQHLASGSQLVPPAVSVNSESPASPSQGVLPLDLEPTALADRLGDVSASLLKLS